MVYFSINKDEVFENEDDNTGEKNAKGFKSITVNGKLKTISSDSLNEKIKRNRVCTYNVSKYDKIQDVILLLLE